MYEKIPHELKSDTAWVNVRDSSKLPMQPSKNKAASSVDPTTWGTFQEASDNVKNGVYQGVGYVFHDNGLVGIDIDAGFDEDGFLSPLAIDIISRCGSYTEKSRSGRGFHILMRGTIPFKGRNNHELHVEIYKTARYFIMTGRSLLFSQIVENQNALDYIVNKYFPEAAVSSDTGIGTRIYTPIYETAEDGKVKLKPTYPPIREGGRNNCLTSLAGQLHSQGYTVAAMYKELLRANQEACKPPLPEWEIESIVRSVTRYRR